MHCPPSPEALRHPVGAAAAGKRRSARPGTPPAAAAQRGLAGGHRRCSPDGSGGSGQEGRGRSVAAGGLRCLRLLLAPGRSRRPLGKGHPARTAAAGRGALRRPRLLPIHFFFFTVFIFYPVTFAFLFPDKLNKRWKFCVCVGERVMSLFIIFLTINASHETRPLLTMPCWSGAARLRSPLPRREPPEGTPPAPGAVAPRGSPRARPVPRSPAGAGRERRPRPDPALSPCRALTCL